MPNIRPTGRRFGPVAPGGGAVIGAGLAGLGQALGAFADVQVEIDRLDQVQFEKVERSEAIAQFTAKQIERNNTAAEILSKAREGRNFESVQQDMNVWETSFNQNLFEGRSQEFRDVFETIDRPARNGSINKLGTAVEAGRLGIVRDNYQIAADNFVESVDAFTTPAEINEFFDTYDETGTGLGLTQAAIDAASGESRRAAMERHIRSLPLLDGLAALSDEDVARALGEDGRERMRRDLNIKANTLQRAQEITSEAHAGVVGLDVLDALVGGESATALISRIRNDDGISPTRQKDMIDLVDVISRAREKGPQPVDPEVVRTNEALSNGLINRDVKEVNLIRKKEALSPEDKADLLEISNRAIATYQEAALKEAKGEFRSSELVKLRFKMDVITEGFLIAEEVAKKGFFENFFEKAFLGPAAIVSPRPVQGIEAAEIDLRVPKAIVSEEIQRMFLGEGKYGDQSSEDKASLEAFLINQAVNTDGSGRPLPREEANKMAQEIFAEAQKQFLREEKKVSEEAIEEVDGLVFKGGDPATEPRQQPRQSLLADIIRSGLNQGMTVERIRAQAADMPLFSDEAFSRALSTMPGIAQEPTLEQLEVGTR